MIAGGIMTNTAPNAVMKIVTVGNHSRPNEKTAVVAVAPVAAVVDAAVKVNRAPPDSGLSADGLPHHRDALGRTVETTRGASHPIEALRPEAGVMAGLPNNLPNPAVVAVSVAA
jgi:hypothetical protein